MVSSEALWPGVFSEIGLVAGLLPQRASISSWDWVRSTTHPPHPPPPQNVDGTLILESSYGHCYPASHTDFWLIQIPDLEREGLSKYYLSQTAHL